MFNQKIKHFSVSQRITEFNEDKLQKIKVEIEALICLNQDPMQEEDYYETHIGKYSAGWRFALAADNFKSLDEVRLNDNQMIVDEYDRELSLDEFKKIVLSSLENPHRNNRDSQPVESEKIPSHLVSPEGLRLVYGEFS